MNETASEDEKIPIDMITQNEHFEERINVELEVEDREVKPDKDENEEEEEEEEEYGDENEETEESEEAGNSHHLLPLTSTINELESTEDHLEQPEINGAMNQVDINHSHEVENDANNNDHRQNYVEEDDDHWSFCSICFEGVPNRLLISHNQRNNRHGQRSHRHRENRNSNNHNHRRNRPGARSQETLCRPFCHDCLVQYILNFINSGKELYLTDTIVCPSYASSGCTHRFSYSEIQHILTPEDFLLYESRLLQSFLQSDLSYKWCPNPGCSNVMQIEALIDKEGEMNKQKDKKQEEFKYEKKNETNKDKSRDKEIKKKKDKNCSSIVCSECNYEFCYKCNLKSHGKMSCSQASNSSKSEKEFRKWSKNNAKPCPNCNVIVEKAGACNHMVCLRCNHQWCWLCGGKYTPNHFSVYNIAGCPGLQSENKEAFGVFKRNGVRVGVVVGTVVGLPVLIVGGIIYGAFHIYQYRQTKKLLKMYREQHEQNLANRSRRT